MVEPRRIDELRTKFEAYLAREIASRYSGDDVLASATRYAMAGGGKRVRPVMCLLAAEAVVGAHDCALDAALAVEMVHTYSLVHDDLPCMDDDDLRRGRPTVHKVHGDAMALLAGDALLTDAFDVLARSESATMVQELSRAAGGAGMALGQALDLHWTGKPGATRSILDGIHLRKTGHLLGAAAALGALAGGATAEVSGAFRTFGRSIGHAFQIFDDLLDGAETTGKSPGKDLAAGKLTYLAMMTRAEAEHAARTITQVAAQSLVTTGLPVGPLIAFGEALQNRSR